MGFDIEVLLNNEEMRKKLNEENRKRAEAKETKEHK